VSPDCSVPLLSQVLLPIVCPFSINLPAPLCSTGVTPLHSSYERSDLHCGAVGPCVALWGRLLPRPSDQLTRDGVPCLPRLTLQSFCLQPPPVASGSICLIPELTIYDLENPVCRERWHLGLRQFLAGSPQRQAESSSLACGPIVHFQLLSTSSCKNAVTFS
jgi:hypothetical protein